MQQLIAAARRIWGEPDGQDLLEYGLLAALIAIFAFGAVSMVGNTIYNIFWSNIATSF